MEQEYLSLEPEHITATIRRLSNRIESRFPGAGLQQVCNRLLQISEQAHERALKMDRPHYLSRGIAVAVIIGVVIAELIAGVANLRIEAIDATMNVVVLSGAAVFFFLSLETRIKRKQALAAIHELRAIAHIIDMHQLSKDPERVVEQKGPQTLLPLEGDTRLLTRFELGRYLDYCSEMLSLTGKIGSVYVRHFADSVVISSVNDVETLCTGLSRKIWQKIMILRADTGRQLSASLTEEEIKQCVAFSWFIQTTTWSWPFRIIRPVRRFRYPRNRLLSPVR